MASLKDLFNNPVSNIINEKKILETGYFESVDEVFELVKSNNRYQTNIDYSNPANFARFGSAVKYYEDAIDYINKTYPHTKSNLEKQEWTNNLSDLEYYIFSKEYPKTTGYFSGSNSYISIIPKTPNNLNLQDNFENSPKTIYGSNFYLDQNTGFTIEFWIKPNTNSGTILELSSSEGKFKIGTVGSDLKINNSVSIINPLPANQWNHLAFSFSGSSVSFYMNGTYQNTKALSTTISGNILKATIFKDVDLISGIYNGYLDEFRIWNTSRTAKQIGRCWKTGVHGNSSTDKSLCVYYKFNEGISTIQDANKFVEDYSGMDNYGIITTSDITKCRITSSAINESGAGTETPDPILYSKDNNLELYNYLYDEDNGRITNAIEYDKYNYNSLYRTIPSWMIEEEQKDDTRHMENFMQVIAIYFDELLNKSKEIKNYKNIKYTNNNEEVLPFYNKILSSTGFDVTDILKNSQISEILLNKTDVNVSDEDLGRIKNIIYQNIYNNLIFILKSKGTEKSIKNFLRAFGVNDNIIKINLYGDNVEYKLKDTYNSTSVYKTILSLSGTQCIKQNNYISSSVLPYTLESMFIFPAIQKNNNANISLFGVNDLKVNFIKDSLDSKSGIFQLTSSLANINLTSSKIYDVYDNSKWSLAIKANSGSISLYGINVLADQKINEFELTSSVVYDFLNINKNIYVGASGSNTTDCKVLSTKFWNDRLTNDEIFYHTKDIENYGRTYFSQYSEQSVNHTHKDIERLLINWTYDTVKTSDVGGNFDVSDEKWFYDDAPTSYTGKQRNYKYQGIGYNFPLSSSDFIERLQIQTMKQSLPETLNSSDMINTPSEDDNVFYGTGKKPEKYYVAFENSMYQIVSDEMLKFAASIADFNNLIGEPKYKYTSEYDSLNQLRDLFFKNIGNTPSIEKYINLYKWIDSSLALMLEQLRPATARGTIGLKPVVENHVFSRNKVQHTLPYFNEKIVDLSVILENTNQNKGINSSLLDSLESKIDVVKNIENIKGINYNKSYEYIHHMKDSKNYDNTKNIFKSEFYQHSNNLDDLDAKQSLPIFEKTNSFKNFNNIKNNNGFISYNIPGQNENFYFTGSELKFIPNKSLDNRYSNKIITEKDYIEPPVEWILPSYAKIKVNTALEPLEIYAPYNSIKNSFANQDLIDYLNNNGNLLLSSKEAIDKNDTVFLDYVYKLPNISVEEISYFDYVFPLKKNMGLDIIRNKPDYEEVSGTGSNGYDRNTAEIRSFWKSSDKDRRRTTLVPQQFPPSYSVLNYTGSYNCLNFPNLYQSGGFFGNGTFYVKHLGGNNANLFSSSDMGISIADQYYAYIGITKNTSIFELEGLTKNLFNVQSNFASLGFNIREANVVSVDPFIVDYGYSTYGDLSPFSEALMLSYISKNQQFYDDYNNKIVDFYLESKPQFIFNNYFGITCSNLIKDSGGNYRFTASLNVNKSYQNGIDKEINPGYDTYKQFSNNIRAKSQYYSTVPEYIISNNRQFLTSSTIKTEGKSIVGFNDNIRNITKTNYEINFSNLLKNTDNKIKLTLNGVKKLLPYSGFYPSNRTMQIISEFSKSYSLENIQGAPDSTRAQRVQTLIQPLFSPGILFNTIKAGIAVDYPVYISSSGVSQSDYYNYDNYNDNLSCVKNYSNRVPFEAILEPEKLLNFKNKGTSLYYLDPTRYSNMFSCSFMDNRYSPYINLESVNNLKNNLYKLSINNFLAEVPNFFLENKLFTYFVSKPESEWKEAQENKVYKMRIKLEQSKNFSMFSTGSGNLIPVESLFGPPSFMSYSNQVRSNIYSSDSYLPFTPSYLKRWRQNFVSNADFNQQNFIELSYNGDGIKPSIQKIFSGSGNSSIRITKYWSTENNSDVTPEPSTNTSYYHHMNVDSSLNLFGKIKSKIITTDSVTGQDLTTEDNPDSSYRWTIQTKFETPLINYKDEPEPAVESTIATNFTSSVTSGSATIPGYYTLKSVASSINGIWNRLGTIPEDNNSIQLSLTDEGITLNDKTGSLLELCGFEKQTKSIGRIADKKVISEAVLMLPYKTANARLLSSDAKSKLVKIDKTNKILKDTWGIKIPRQTINDLLKVSDYTKIKPRFGSGRHSKDETIREIKKILETNKTIDKNNSIVQLMINMVNYNIPPYLNWLYDTRIDPFVMYIAEFTHELSQQDLANIWQGTLPEIGTIPEEQTVSLDYQIKEGELLNKEMVDYVKDSNFKAEIFKIKKRANFDYKKDATLDETDDLIRQEIPWYSFNWPYDHFSLVELINIEGNSSYEVSKNNNLDIVGTINNIIKNGDQVITDLTIINDIPNSGNSSINNAGILPGKLPPPVNPESLKDQLEKDLQNNPLPPPKLPGLG